MQCSCLSFAVSQYCTIRVFFSYNFIQHCFICLPSDSTVSEDVLGVGGGIQPERWHWYIGVMTLPEIWKFVISVIKAGCIYTFSDILVLAAAGIARNSKLSQ